MDGTYIGQYLPSDNRHGQLNSALLFQDVSRYIILPYQLLQNKSEFSIMLWIKLNDLTGNQTILHGTKSGDNDLYLQKDKMYLNKIRYDFEGWDTMVLNEWYHIAVTVNDDLLHVYLDGVMVNAIEKDPWTVDISDGGLIFGQDQDGGVQQGISDPLQAVASDLRFYDSKINADMVYQVYIQEKYLCQYGCNQCNQQNQCIDCKGDRILHNNECLCPSGKIEIFQTYCLDQDSTINNNLIAHFPFKYVNNHDIVDLVNGKIGTKYKCTFHPNRKGEINSAIRIIDETTYISLPNELIDGFSVITFSIWVKKMAPMDAQHIIMSGAQNDSEANEFMVTAQDIWLDNTKQHFIYSFDTTQFSIYLNGELIYQRVKPSFTFSVAVGGFIIGQDQDSVGSEFEAGQHWQGDLSDLRIYSAYYNGQQARNLYNSILYNCSQGCIMCEQFSSICALCKGNRYIQGEQCLCPIGTYENYVTYPENCPNCDHKCEQCSTDSDNCDVCKGDRQDPPTCSCQENYYDDGVSENCVQCKYESCKSCENTTTCLNCIGSADQPSSRINFNCVCPDEYYSDLQNYDECQKCDFKCTKCENQNDNCTECRGDRILQQDCQCNSHQYDDGVSENCIECHDTCIICNSTECTKCMANRELQSGQQDCSCGEDNIDHLNELSTYWCTTCEDAVITPQLSNDYTQITITFYVDIDVPNYQGNQDQLEGTNQLCLHLFEENTILLLGDNFKCKIQQKQIVIFLGIKPQIMFENDQINIKSDVIQRQDCIDNNKYFQNFYLNTLLAPQIFLPPSIELLYPTSKVTLCQDIEITSYNIQYDGLRGLTNFQWTLFNSDAQDTSKIKEFLQYQNENKSQDTFLVIPQLTLEEYRTYVFEANYYNFAGVLGVTQFTIETLSTKGTYAKIQQSQPFVFKNWQQNEFVADINYLDCSSGQTLFIDKSLNIEWQQKQSDSSQYLTLQNYNSQPQDKQSNYVIEKYQNIPGNTYQIQILVNIINEPLLKSSHFVQFKIEVTPLSIYIHGGNRLQAYSKELDLKGEAKDIDLQISQQQEGITTSWGCVNMVDDNNCKDIGGKYIPLGNTQELNYEAKLFEPYNSFKFTYTGVKSTKQNTDSVVIIIVETDLPVLTVSLPEQIRNQKLNKNDDLELEVFYDQNPDNAYYSLIIIYKFEVVATKSYNYNKFAFQIWDIFNDFQSDESEFIIRVSVYDPQFFMPSQSSFTTQINFEPIEGVVSIYPNSGKALETKFNLQCEDFYDEDQTLTYKFSYYLQESLYQKEIQLGNKQIQSYSNFLQDYTSQNSIETILPSGKDQNILILVSVSDSLGAIRNVTQTIQVEQYSQDLDTSFQKFQEIYYSCLDLQFEQKLRKINILVQEIGQLFYIQENQYQSESSSQFLKFKKVVYDDLSQNLNQINNNKLKDQVIKSLNILQIAGGNLLQIQDSSDIDSQMTNINDIIQEQQKQIEEMVSQDLLNKGNNKITRKQNNIKEILGKTIQFMDQMQSNINDNNNSEDNNNDNNINYQSQEQQIFNTTKLIKETIQKSMLPNSDEVVFEGDSIYQEISVLTQKYIQNKYFESYQPGFTLPDSEEQENQNFFSELDLKDQQKLKEKIDPKKYSADIWERPSDNKFQEANFSIGMKEYNQMIVDYKKEKQQKIQKKEDRIKQRRLKRKEMIDQKLQAMGIAEPKVGDNYSSGESDFEVKKIFRKPKELKPKLNLEQDNSCVYGTSESEQEEKIMYQSDESFDFNNEKIEGIDIGQNSEDDKYKDFKEISKNDKIKFKEQEKAKKEQQINNVTELMRQKEESIKKEQQEKQQKILKKKQQMAAQAAKQKQQQQIQQKEKQQEDKLLKQQEELQQQEKLKEKQQELQQQQQEQQELAKLPENNQQTPSKEKLNTQQSIGKTAVTGGSQFPNQFNQFTTAQTDQTVELGVQLDQHTMKTEPNMHPNTNNINNNLLTEKAEYQMLEVKNFELNTQFQRPASVLQVRQQKLHEKNSTSKIQNKIFAPHPAVKSTSIDKLSKTTKKPFFKMNQSQKNITSLKSESAIDVKQKQKANESQSRYSQNSNNNAYAKINKPKKKHQSNKTEFYEAPKVIVKGDINVQNFTKSDVPIVDLIPTEEQGFEKKWRDQIIYDTNCPGHKEMKQFKELIDKAEDTRQIAIDINNKLEMPGIKKKNQQIIEQKIIPYNEVIEYLKTDERNYIEKNMEPFNKIVKETMKKHGHFPEPIPENKNESEINQNKISNIRQQKDFKISRDKGPKLNEKYTLEYMNKNQNNLTFQEKQKIYDQLYADIDNEKDQEINIDELQKKQQQKRIDQALKKVDQKIKYSEDENNKITNHVLREVIYKANNYDQQTEPKLTEKEILEQIERDDIPFSQKAKLYEYLEVIEEIRMKKNKTSQGMLKKLEEKEIERAQSNAHLAYHYQKLKKYMDPAYIAQHLKELGIQQKDPGKIQYREIKDDYSEGLGVVDNRLEMGLNKYKQKQFNYVGGDSNLDMLNKLNNKKKQQNEDLPDYEKFYNRVEKLKQRKLESRPEVKFKPISHDMQEDYQKYVKKLKPYKPPANSMASLEELTQANLRRLEDNYIETQAVTVEEQMMKHAKELKDKVKQRELLKSNIDKYIKENPQKQQEFNNWAWQELEHAEDKEYCFLQYVKAIREGKVKNQLY